MKRAFFAVLAAPGARRAAAAIACAAALAACPSPGGVDLPPVAFAGLDQIAAPNTTVTLDGSGSYDPDGAQGAELEHAWLPISVPAGSSAVLSDDRIAMPTVAVDLVGSYVFRLVVTDANGNESLPDVVAVTVNPYLEVVSVVPVNGAIDAPADTPVVAVFSEPVQAATVNAQTVLLRDAAGVVDVAITLDEGNTVAVARPTAALAHGTVYTFELQQEIRTLRGFSLAQPLTSTFSTAPGTDATPPRVVSVAPANGVGDVGRSESVTVTFSEPIDPTTVTAATFTLNDGTTDVAGTIAPTAGDLRATLTPSAPLTGGLVFDVTVTTGVQDVAGNALAAPFTSTFSTSSAADTSPPAVMAVDPGNGFTHVAIQSPVVVTFSEPVSPSAVTDRSCFLTDPNGATVTGSIAMSVGNTVATLTPAAAMAYETTYTVNVTGGVTDWDGNPITPPFSSTFDTVAEASDFDRFEVAAAPTSMTVGETATLTITSKRVDGATNIIYNNLLSVLLSHNGSSAATTWSGAALTDNGDGTASLAGGSFINGVATVSMTATVPQGPIAVTVLEQDTGLSRTGTTTASGTDMTWQVGGLDHFIVVASPTALDAGTPVNITVTAADEYDNTILAYSNAEALELTHTGTAATTSWLGTGITDNGDGTASIASGTFFGGVALARLVNDSAEGPVTISITDRGGAAGSTADSGTDVTWSSGGLVGFEVTASPTALTAGQSTTITIEAKDSGGNTIATYQNTVPITLAHSGTAAPADTTWAGGGVTDEADGSGSLAAGTFVGGVATVTLVNDVAEGPVVITVTENDSGRSRSGNTVASSTSVTWSPGVLDHFSVGAFPTAPQTGSSSTVTITAQDVYGNTIAGYQNTLDIDLTQNGGTGATLTWGGAGVTDNGDGTATLAAGQFSGGGASALVSDSTAEGPVELIVTENDAPGVTGSTAASGSNVTWQTGGIFSFEVVAAPTDPTAGSTTAITITAKDSGGNTIAGYQNTLDIVLAHSGSAPAAAVNWGGAGVSNAGDGNGWLGGANRFVTGVATVTLSNNVAEGPVIITVTEQDTGNNRTGNTVATSTNVTWTPGPVDHFDVVATPTALDTTQASTITITARDVFGNLIATYDNTNPITLDQDGSTAGKLWNDNACLGIPSGSNGGGDNTLAGGCWAGGQTSLTLRSSVAEGPVVVTVTENDTPGASGSPPGIVWEPGQIDHFYVASDVTLRTTGEQATITIEARDQFDNVITAYDNIAAITLAQTGATGGKIWDNNLCLGTAPGSDASGDNTLTGGCWAGGLLSLTLENQVAEADVNVIVTENDSGLNRTGSLQIQASRITWEPGPLDHFDVRVSTTSDTAGRAVTVTTTAQDQFDNTVTAYDNIAAIALDQNGSVSGKAWDHPTAACLGSPGGSNATGDNTLVAGCWVDGVVTLTLENTVSEGPIAITVTEYDTGSGLTGSSAGVTWTPGGLDHFRLLAAPTGRVAGSASDLTIVAEDLYSNVITTYGNTAPIDLTQNAGTTGITWTGLGDCAANVTDLGSGAATMTDCFLSGVAQVQISNLQAEGPVTAAATENDTALFRSGTTAFTGTNITWTPAAIDRFWVTASPTSLAVNSATSLTIQAEDGTDFPAAGRGNPIPGYATSNPVDVVPSCSPACAGSISYTPAAWDNGDDTATIPAGTAFDGLGQIAMTVSADFDTSASPTTITVTQQVSLETGDTSPATGSDTDVSWLSVGCPAPTANPAVVGGSPVSSCAIALDGTASTGGGTETISTYAWTFIYVPAGSAVNGADLTPDAANSAPAFTADRPGSYVVELAVTNSCGNDNTKSLLIDYVPGLPAAGDVLITEVITDPQLDWSDSVGGNGVPYDPTPSTTGSPRSSNDQWVELYNATACPIDLSVSTTNPDGWTLLLRDTSGTETPQLGSDAAREWFTPGSSLTSLLPGGYMIMGDPARGGGGGGTRMDDEIFLELWYGQVGGGVAVDDVELDDPGGQNEEADIYSGDPDGDGAPAGTSTSVNDEAIYRHLAPPYADTDVDVDDWAQTTSGATPGADNEP